MSTTKAAPLAASPSVVGITSDEGVRRHALFALMCMLGDFARDEPEPGLRRVYIRAATQIFNALRAAAEGNSKASDAALGRMRATIRSAFRKARA